MCLLVYPTHNLGSHSHKRVYGYVVHSPLDMELQIVALVAKELSLVNDYSNFLWKPSGHSPELFGFGAVDSSIQHQDSRHAMYSLLRCKRLISLTSTTPPSTGRLTFNAGLEDLGERWLLRPCIPHKNFLPLVRWLFKTNMGSTYRQWIEKFIDKSSPRSGMLTSTSHTTNASGCRGSQNLSM